jgi:hypothetical protein
MWKKQRDTPAENRGVNTTLLANTTLMRGKASHIYSPCAIIGGLFVITTWQAPLD